MIEYVEAAPVSRLTVKKQVWDGEKFVSMVLVRINGVPANDQIEWLRNTFGSKGVSKKGRYWDFSLAGDFSVFDEQLYTWYTMKWNK